MIRDRIEALVRELLAFPIQGNAAMADRLTQILAEEKGWRGMDSAPRDDTVLVVIEAGPANSTYPEGAQRSVHPRYIDEDDRICCPGTLKPEPGMPGAWRAVAWQPLPEPPPGPRP